MVHRRSQIALVLAFALGRADAMACSPDHIDSPQQLVARADAIYRLRPESGAESLKVDPQRFYPWPNSQIRFRVVGVVKGPALSSIVLPGSFAKMRDPNDHPPPYRFVRPGGRGGNCYATSYLKGQEYLVFLKGKSAYWSPLAPTGEEISGPKDPWLVWVLKHAHPAPHASGQGMDRR
jgi:hypothetical protein